jgi:predicted 3-demethylubiquinone-9 3-methyltransferase (glyoxalase superfamily)
MKAKNTICLWFDKEAHDAARFYAATFPNSEVTAVHKAPSDYPNGKAGDVLTVEFTVLGIPCLGLNGGRVPRLSNPNQDNGCPTLRGFCEGWDSMMRPFG